ncbi:hypothetical protein GQR58_029672 [Nymphon striatum]|nr:hypothetical protein GQR58_029672 [Nymphon striatum]
MSEHLNLGADGRMRCWWPSDLDDYIIYHDEEWGRPTLNDDRTLREDLPRRFSVRPVVDHDPSQARELSSCVRELRDRQGPTFVAHAANKGHVGVVEQSVKLVIEEAADDHHVIGSAHDCWHQRRQVADHDVRHHDVEALTQFANGFHAQRRSRCNSVRLDVGGGNFENVVVEVDSQHSFCAELWRHRSTRCRCHTQHREPRIPAQWTSASASSASRVVGWWPDPNARPGSTEISGASASQLFAAQQQQVADRSAHAMRWAAGCFEANEAQWVDNRFDQVLEELHTWSNSDRHPDGSKACSAAQNNADAEGCQLDHRSSDPHLDATSAHGGHHAIARPGADTCTKVEARSECNHDGRGHEQKDPDRQVLEVGNRPQSQAGGHCFDRTERTSSLVGLALVHVEVALTERGVQRAHCLGTQLFADMGGDAQHAETSRVTVFVAGGKLGVVVLGFVQDAKADEAPVHRVVGLRNDLFNPTRGDPGKGTNRIPEELDVGVIVSGFGHASKLTATPRCAAAWGDRVAVMEWWGAGGGVLGITPPPGVQRIKSALNRDKVACLCHTKVFFTHLFSGWCAGWHGTSGLLRDAGFRFATAGAVGSAAASAGVGVDAAVEDVVTRVAKELVVERVAADVVVASAAAKDVVAVGAVHEVVAIPARDCVVAEVATE